MTDERARLRAPIRGTAPTRSPRQDLVSHDSTGFRIRGTTEQARSRKSTNDQLRAAATSSIAAVSISPSVVSRPSVNRIAPSASAVAIPIAVSTRDAFISPE